MIALPGNGRLLALAFLALMGAAVLAGCGEEEGGEAPPAAPPAQQQ
jgi:hypothetical protein